MRVSLTLDPVNLDYPWAGSATFGNAYFRGGETEDYPVVVVDGPVDAGSDPVDGQVWLGAPLPNPSGGAMSIRFSLPQSGTAQVGVYDVAGRLVRSLLRESKAAGAHAVLWDGKDDDGAEAPAGVYLIRLQAAGRVLTRSAVRLQ
jgi:hypothetical protein